MSKHQIPTKQNYDTGYGMTRREAQDFVRGGFIDAMRATDADERRYALQAVYGLAEALGIPDEVADQLCQAAKGRQTS